MAKLTYRQREKLPDSAFLLPKHRKLPYKTASGKISLPHVRNALARADQVVGVPKRELQAAVKKAERILLEHGGYERNTMRKNFFRSKPKAPLTAAEQKADELAELRSTRVWKDKYRYFNISEGYSKADAERAADQATEEYWARRRKQQSSGIARNGSAEFEETAESLQEYEKPGFYWLAEERDEQTAIDNYEEVMVFEGSLEDAAYDYFDQMGEIDAKNAEMYFDYDAFGRDLSISGDDVQGAIEQIEDLRENDEDEEADQLQDWVDTMESMSDQERGEEYIESIGSLEDALGKNVTNYFDYEAFGRDADLNGDWTTFNFEGTNYVILNALDH